MDYHTLLHFDSLTSNSQFRFLSVRKLDSRATILSNMVVTHVQVPKGGQTTGFGENKLVIVVAASIGGTVLLLVGIIFLLLRSRRASRRTATPEKPSADQRLSTQTGNKVTLWSNIWSTLGTAPPPSSADGALLKISPDSVRGKSFFRVDQGRSAPFRNPWDSRARLSKPSDTTPYPKLETVETSAGPSVSSPAEEKSSGRDYLIPSYYHTAPSDPVVRPPVPRRKVSPRGSVYRAEDAIAPVPPGNANRSSYGLTFLHTPHESREKARERAIAESPLGEEGELSPWQTRSPAIAPLVPKRTAPAHTVSASIPERPARARKESVTMPRSIFVQPEAEALPSAKPQRLTAVSPLRAPATLLRSLSGRLPRSESGDTDDRATVRWVSPESEADTHERSPEIYFEMRPYSPTSAGASTHTNRTRRQIDELRPLPIGRF
jgi:hypothetical protein